MGYFNIFYKLTRIIDFMTRKRNRKFILALCLIGGIVFFSPNVANAQFTNLDSQNLQEIRTRIVDIDSTLDTYISSIYASITAQEYDIDAIRAYVNLLSNDVNSMKTYLYNTYTHVVTLKNTLLDMEEDLDSLLLKIDSLNTKADNLLTACNTIIYDIEYYGELNHADLEDLKQIIKEYLYGDEEWFQVTFSSINGLGPVSQDGQIVFGSNNGYTTYYFKVHGGSHYAFDWINTGTFASWKVRHGYCDSIPSTGVPTSTFATITSDSQITFVGDDTYQYYYITIYNQDIKQLKILSDYNYGQELGIYGGLTNIDVQVQEQGHETRATITEQSELTRNTITDTSIPTNEMTIDTSIVDGVSNEENDNFLISIINKFQNVITPSSSVTTITIPIPKTGKNIVLRSDLLSSHIGNTIIGTYITVFWYVVFFIYFFKFAYRVINWVVTGEIIEKPSGFMKYLMDQNAIITASMM